MTYKILIVDDEPANLRVLERLICREYLPFTADSGEEALRLLSLHDFAMIISDQRMPGMTGLEFLKKAAELRKQTVRILLTGYTDVETLVDAMNSGVVYQYLTKPWVNDDLLRIIKRGLQHHESIKRSHLLELDIARLNQRDEAAHQGILDLWSEIVRLRSPELHSHAERISRYARTIAEMLSLDADEIERIAIAASIFPCIYETSLIDDVLIGSPIPDAEIEVRVEVMESRLAPFSELRRIDEWAEIEDIIRYANEYFDGDGYPNRLAGDRIPLSSRILAVVRGYDLITEAPIDEYNLTHEQAVSMLSSLAGHVFDPSIVDLLKRAEFLLQVTTGSVPDAPIYFAPVAGNDQVWQPGW